MSEKAWPADISTVFLYRRWTVWRSVTSSPSTFSMSPEMSEARQGWQLKTSAGERKERRLFLKNIFLLLTIRSGFEAMAKGMSWGLYSSIFCLLLHNAVIEKQGHYTEFDSLFWFFPPGRITEPCSSLFGAGDSGISGVVSSCGDSDNGMTGVSNSPFLIFYFLSRIVEFGNSWGLAVLGIMRQIWIYHDCRLSAFFPFPLKMRFIRYFLIFP